jgi:hypothetical protein
VARAFSLIVMENIIYGEKHIMAVSVNMVCGPQPLDIKCLN